MFLVRDVDRGVRTKPGHIEWQDEELQHGATGCAGDGMAQATSTALVLVVRIFFFLSFCVPP